MRNLATVLLVIFSILLTTQLVRHTYMRVFYNQESVMDKYSKKETDFPNAKSLSLKELSMIYADAEKRVKIFESGKSRKELDLYNSSDEPYYKKNKIQEMIASRESDHKMIREIIVFWIAGILLIAGGSFVYLKYEKWVGASVVISGFIEMIWRLGPMFFMTGTAPESLMILTVKILFTALTLGGVIAFRHYFKNYIN